MLRSFKLPFHEGALWHKLHKYLLQFLFHSIYWWSSNRTDWLQALLTCLFWGTALIHENCPQNCFLCVKNMLVLLRRKKKKKKGAEQRGEEQRGEERLLDLDGSSTLGCPGISVGCPMQTPFSWDALCFTTSHPSLFLRKPWDVRACKILALGNQNPCLSLFLWCAAGKAGVSR